MAALALTACSSSDSSDSASAKPPTSASSTASASADPHAADKKAAGSAYTQFRAEQAKAYAKGSSNGTEVTRYATGDALGEVEADLLSLSSGGNVAEGAPVVDVRSVTIDGGGKLAKASLTDCLDVSKWHTVSKKTRKPLPTPSNQLTRYVNKVTLEKWGKRWMVLSDKSTATKC
ncbi:hypothetical protein ABT127_34765 [Streptomyces sp. NPDC001904]|uniref:hypothetical protein n=1 Tax=Streptomyces sp. NPDC001904 TaxID=3154531 RepID=UPI0033207BB6